MLCNLTVAQFDAWYYYSQHEPFGFVLYDFIQAQLTCAIYNATGRCNPLLKVSDFLISEAYTQDQAPKTLDWRELKDKFRQR